MITNGSIYIEMAHLSTGQEILLSLPDERLPDTIAGDGATMKAGLAATFSPHRAGGRGRAWRRPGS